MTNDFMLCNYNIYPDVRPSNRCCRKIVDLFIQMACNEGKSIKFDIPTEYTKLMMAFHIACENKKKSPETVSFLWKWQAINC